MGIRCFYRPHGAQTLENIYRFIGVVNHRSEQVDEDVVAIPLKKAGTADNALCGYI